MAHRVNPQAEYIKYRLKLKGSSPSKIARERGVTHTGIWNVIQGRSESMPTKRLIAKIIGERIEDLWPDDEQRVA